MENKQQSRVLGCTLSNVSDSNKLMKSRPKTTQDTQQPVPFWQQRKGDIIIILTALATVGLIVRIISGGSIGISGEWTWPARTEPGGNWVPLVIVSACLIAVAGWLTRPGRWDKTNRRLRVIWLLILVVIAWALALSFFMTRVKPVAFTASVIVSPQATSYFTVGASLPDLPAALRDYPSLMQRLPQHARTHPPGPIVFFWTVDRMVRHMPGLASGLESLFRHIDPEGTKTLGLSLDALFNARIAGTDAIAAVFSAIVLAFLGSLTLIPLYLLGSALYKPATALYACMLFIVVPSFLLFAPSVDQLVLLFGMLTLWGFHLLRTRGNPIVGFFFALGMLMSLGSAVIGLMVVLWWIIEARLSRRRLVESEAEDAVSPALPHPAFLRGVLLAAGLFILTFVILWMTLGMNFVAVLRAGLAAHRDITLIETGRTYWKWVVYNPIEFAVFLGIPLMIWAIVGLRSIPSTWLRTYSFVFAWLAALLLLDASGWVRAEVGRIWLFLMPPATLLATHRLVQLGKRFDLGYFATLALQLGQAVTMKAALDIFILK